MANEALRSARERALLSQAELAALAGVSRQLVSSAEAGRHAPAVDAALRIADVLGEGVDALFGAPPTAAVAVLGGPLREGEPVVAGRVGERLAAAPMASLTAGDAAWALPDGVVRDGVVTLLPGARANGFVVVGCDPLLGLCEALLGRAGGPRLVAVPGTSGAAVAALAGGRAHAALVHGPPGRLPERPEGVSAVHVARWRVGIGLPRELGAPSLEAVLAGAVPLVQREPSAASQQALMRAAGGVPAPGAAGAPAGGHVEAARRALLGRCAAVTFEPAAHQHGLGFLPLETHVVELWTDARWEGHPGARALGDLLTSAALARRVALIGGYDLDRCGAPAGGAG